jgi:predicted ATP-grasp superfamily ATP-dependent carboligase
VQAALDAGFNVPDTVLASTTSDLLSNKQSFPLILKPAKSVSELENRLLKYGTWICGNQEELEAAVAEWDSRVPLLVQPFIPGIGEGIFGLATPYGITVWSAHRRLRMMNPHGSGSSACISQSAPEDLMAPVERLIEKAGWRGLFMIELLRDPAGTAWFMELNGRPWGSMALARRQGLEYPAWNVELAIDPQSPVRVGRDDVTGVVCRHLGRELMYPLFVLRGPKSKALNNWPSFWKAIRDIARVGRRDTFYNWRRDDARVLIADCYYTLRDQIFRRKG